ncbi:MAG: ABC transporter substrate-binding protein [Mycobacteriales bacterium]
MRRRIALLALAALVSGCGSTVQITGTATTGPTDPLGGQLQGTTTTSTGTAAPAAAAGTPVAPGSVVPRSQALAAQATTAAQTQAQQALPLVTQGPGTAITAPIELGFMTTSVGNAQQAGLNIGQTYSDKQAYAALVKEYNLHGGLAGRKIVPVYGDTDTASSDWNTQFQAACQHLTTDNHVQAVLGYVFAWLDSFEGCLASHKVPHLYGGYQPGDTQAQQDFPGIVSVAHPTVDVANETVLSGAVQSGVLTTKSKLGILYDGCGHGDRAYTRSTEPWLKAQGLHYEAVSMPCASGSGDVSSAAAAVKSAQLQFAAHGVNVVFVTNPIALLLFMNNAESQGYRPTYVNQGLGAALESQGGAVPTAQEKLLHGYGWMPGTDVDQQHQPYATTPQQAACLAKLKHQGLAPQAYNDFMFAYVTCDSLDLYAKALALTGGRSDATDVRSALLQVMPHFTGASTYAGSYAVSSRQRGGPGEYREIAWADSCSCFTYRGPVRATPTA